MAKNSDDNHSHGGSSHENILEEERKDGNDSSSGPAPGGESKQQQQQQDSGSSSNNSFGAAGLNQLESDLVSKQRSRGRVTSPILPGAFSESNLPATTSSRPPPTTPVIAYTHSGRNQLHQLQDDLEAKNIARRQTTSSNGTTTLSSQILKDMEAKQRVRGMISKSSSRDSNNSHDSQLEQDVMTKRRSSSTLLTSRNSNDSTPGAHSVVRPVPTTAGSGRISLNQLEQDAMTKLQASSSSGGRLVAPSTVSSPPSSSQQQQHPTSTGTGSLTTFQQDIESKHQALQGRVSSPVMPAAGSNPLETSRSSKQASGSVNLSVFEQDLAAKSRARPSLVVTQNDRSSQMGFELAEEASPAPVFSRRESHQTNGSSEQLDRSERETYEASRLDERIAQKCAQNSQRFSPNPQPTVPQQPSRQDPSGIVATSSSMSNDDYDDSKSSNCHESEMGSTAAVRQPPHPILSLPSADSSGGGVSGGVGPKEFDQHYIPHYHQEGLVGVERARVGGVDKDFNDINDGITENGDVLMTTFPPPHGHQTAADMEYGEMGGQLAVATAIEEEEEDDFIPAAVEYDPDAKPPLYKNRRCRLYGFVGICCICAAVAVAIVTTQVSNNESLAPPLAPTVAPTTFREALGIEEEIKGVFGSSYLEDPESLQSQAVQWLIHDDPYQIQPDSDNLIQRFVMALFYLQTSQEGPWLSCNPPQGNQKDQCYFLVLTDPGADPWRYVEMLWTRWMTGEHECDWAGVTCHSDKVTDLNLDGMDLTGTFPAELIKLDYLRRLSLTFNDFTGTLPRELSQMKHLTDIELQYNEFTGTIPREWYGAKNLIHLNVGGNQLRGSIPSEFGRLTDLQQLYLHKNNLSGSLPMELFSLTSLKWMYIGNNLFTGSIPTEVGQLTKLEYFFLHGSPITGKIPLELAKLTEMREIGFYDTNMEGTVPSEIFQGFDKWLRVFDVSGSNFSGTIPSTVGLCQKLEWFLAFDNNFTGTIPEEAGQMESLRRFQIHGNDIGGSIPDGICQMRGENALRQVSADCSTIGSGITPVTCEPGCCTECCNQETSICLPTAA